MKILFLQLHDNSNGFRVNLHEIAKRVNTGRVDASGTLLTQLQISRCHSDLGEGQVRQDDGQVVFHADHQTGLALIAAIDDLKRQKKISM